MRAKTVDTELVLAPTANIQGQESCHSPQNSPQIFVTLSTSSSYHAYTTARKNRTIIQVMYGNLDKSKEAEKAPLTSVSEYMISSFQRAR
jgi:hypothetical protein